MKPTIRFVGAAILGIATAALLMEGLLWVINEYDYQALVYDPTNGLVHYQPDTEYHSVGSCYDLEAHINNLGLYGPDLSPKGSEYLSDTRCR